MGARDNIPQDKFRVIAHEGQENEMRIRDFGTEIDAKLRANEMHITPGHSGIEYSVYNDRGMLIYTAK